MLFKNHKAKFELENSKMLKLTIRAIRHGQTNGRTRRDGRTGPNYRIYIKKMQ